MTVILSYFCRFDSEGKPLQVWLNIRPKMPQPPHRKTSEIHSAKAAMAGFLFQIVRALTRMAGAKDGTFVSIETLDDVVVEFADGTKILEQDKLSFCRNPVPDGSKNFWKTLSIWIGLIDDKEVSLELADFHLVSTFPVKTGIASMLKACSADRENEKIVKEVLKIAKAPVDEVKEYAEIVAAWPLEKLRMLIARITVTDDSCSDSREELANKLNVEKNIRDPVVRGLIGWLTDALFEHFELASSTSNSDEALKISIDTFRAETNRLIATFYNRKIVLRASQDIIAEQEDIDAEKNARFVKQLQLLEFGDEEDELVIEAILDYLKADEETTRLAEKNEITKKRFQEYKENLRSHWKYCWRKARISPATTEHLTGQFIFNETMQVNISLDELPVTHSYLNRGTYHAMANQPDATGIGWHPNYQKILKSDASA